MPGPPPPPPAAPPPMCPPPPMFSSSKSTGDNRGALLNSIRQGTRLKKAVTNDRSAPLVSGGVKSSPNNSTTSSGGGFSSSNKSMPNGLGLGGLFSEGMPKLRPAGSRDVKRNNGEFASLNSVNNSRNNNLNGGSSLPHVLPQKVPSNNFHNEVQSALKKQMASDSNRSRGPPPPAPTRNISQSIENLQNSNNKQSHHRSKHSNSNGLHLNISNLHKSIGNIPSPTSTPQTPKSFNPLQVNSSTLHRKANSSANLTLFDSTDLSNNSFPSRSSNRKPHLAPKPPVLNGVKPAPPPKRIINRAHSMRTPRSPSPQSPEDSTYPTKFGTVRNMTSMLDKPSYRTRPALNGRPHQNPPPPPNKIVKPPNHAPPPPPNVIPHPPNHAPPPPPPTRTNSQQHQPQLPVRASPSIPPNSIAPPPPPRHLSMRDMISNKRQPYIDLDAKFRSEFHPVHQFPPPGVYRGLLKAYTIRSVGSKQQAPLPPNHIQTNTRMWDSSTC